MLACVYVCVFMPRTTRFHLTPVPLLIKNPRTHSRALSLTLVSARPASRSLISHRCRVILCNMFGAIVRTFTPDAVASVHDVSSTHTHTYRNKAQLFRSMGNNWVRSGVEVAHGEQNWLVWIFDCFFFWGCKNRTLSIETNQSINHILHCPLIK